MTQTLTRAVLADAFYEVLGLSHAECSDLVDATVEEMIDGLLEDGELKISLFGTFRIREKNERVGRNPRTKKEVPITARKVATFRASEKLLTEVNS